MGEEEGKESKEGEEAKGETKGEGKEEGNKKRYRKIDLNVTFQRNLSLSRSLIKDSIELEASMAMEDQLIRDTSDKRNDLEAYLYAMRDKLAGELKDYSTPTERETLTTACTAAEDWLYGDGFEAQKSDYIKKLAELKVLGDVIEKRATEATNRPVAIDALRKQIDLVKAFCANYDEGLAHIPEDDRDRLRREVGQIESWIYDMLARQGESPKCNEPVLTCEMISQKRQGLFTRYQEIKNRPKPVAPTPAAASGSGSAGSEGKEKDEPMEQAAGGPEDKEAK
jgi:heat shock protein 4